jgi:tetratricopeptide (TPR) repeat protein
MKFKLFKRPVKPGARRDYRVFALVAAIVGTALLGYGISLLPERGVAAVTQAALQPASRADLSDLPKASPDQQRPSSASLESLPAPAASGTKKALAPKAPEATGPAKILQAATAQIDAKRFEAAITSLNDARAQVQDDPQSYLLMARALEGKADYNTARDFYAAAIDRNGYLADAYFGFATTSEKMGDLEAAIGGMRNFLHVQPNADPQKLQIVQARSAIWEWESKLGRGAWGATKGIPPGFSEAELKRDGRGVGVKMPLEETKRDDGSMKYEIKAQDKFKLFKP